MDEKPTPLWTALRSRSRRLRERVLQFLFIIVWITVFVVAGFISAGTGFSLWVRGDAATAGGGATAVTVEGEPPSLGTAHGLRLSARVRGEAIEVWRDGGFRPVFLAGVNLGSSVPGHDPGAVAAGRADYDRWLGQMREMGVGVVRIYTILPPAFYQALRDHNLRHPTKSILLVQGVWIPEERWYATGDAFDDEVMRDMRAEIVDAVRAVHGAADIPVVRGHASGSYRADVSPWLVAWSFGIEWEPTMVIRTNELNKGRRPYVRGRYIRATSAASPMESWIAEHMDTIAEQEVARGVSVPVTFTNWITTDPLRHPEEPLPSEDAVSVDAMHLHATDAWPGGYFASIHAYPYYPDFLSLEPGLLKHRRAADGRVDPYAGYIQRLRRHHRGVPLVVTEVGQPSAFGCAHRAQLRRDQGCMSERAAGVNLVSMMDGIRGEGAAGALVFMWLDEWFKFTWNTIDYELPADRRRLWRNPLTNEEHFGLVAVEPGRTSEVVLDGRDDEWETKPVIASGEGPVSQIRMTHDAEAVYLGMRVDPKLWERERIVIGLDAHRAGNRGLPGVSGVSPESDVAVVLTPGRGTRIWHAAWVDPIGMRYGGFADPEMRLSPTRRADLTPGSGAWVPLRQLLSYPLVVPTTGRRIAANIVDSSRLLWGPTDPSSPAFDDRNMVMGAGDFLEVKIPWGMATFADPSSHRVYELRLHPDPRQQVVTTTIEKLGVSVLVGDRLLTTPGYTWAGWDEVEWHERPKAGSDLLKAAFDRYRDPSPLG